MKPFSNCFKKINSISISIIIMFAIIGVSYCDWDDMLILNCNLKSGRLELQNNNEKSIYNINLNDSCNDFCIPFNIINRSTLPVKEKEILCSIYGEDVTDACKIVFNEYEDNEIKGEIILDLNKIDEIMMQKEVQDYSLITEPIIIREMLTVEMEFIQANIVEDGWNEIINFDICINKTIMPIIPEVVPVIIAEIAPETVLEVVPETVSLITPEVSLELATDLLPIINDDNSEILSKSQEEKIEEIISDEQSSGNQTIDYTSDEPRIEEYENFEILAESTEEIVKEDLQSVEIQNPESDESKIEEDKYSDENSIEEDEN